MKSTAENLRSICLRLIITGLVLFVFTELVMAFITLFIFMPEQQQNALKEKEHFLRIGIEQGAHKSLRKQLVETASRQIDYEVIDVAHGIEAIHGLSNKIYDVIATDFLSATYLVENGQGIPVAYLKNEDQETAFERLLLIGHKQVPEFLMQTQGMRLILTGVKGKVERIVAEKFLNYKLKDVGQWYSSVGVAISEEYAMEALKSGSTDLVLILESDFKRMYNEEQRTAFKVIWYSEPLPVRVAVMRNDLPNSLEKYTQELFNGENTLGDYWQPFNESLTTMKDWQFRISGKKFAYNKDIVKEYSVE